MSTPILTCELVAILERLVSTLDEAQIRRRGVDGSFAVVEHVWHLADLEVEGFAVRIHRLCTEVTPTLPSFVGDRIAREREYLRLDVREGLRRFARARRDNLERLQAVDADELPRAGTLDGVGPIELRDLPRLMRDHDRSHAQELAALLREVAAAPAVQARLHAFSGRGAEVPSPCARRHAMGEPATHPTAEPTAHQAPSGRRWLARVRAMIRARLMDGPPRLSELAQRLRMSPRTLQRRLASYGVDLQCLVEEVRCELALSRVGRRRLADLASALGYAEVRAFQRAFKRWTGVSPSAYRPAPSVDAHGC